MSIANDIINGTLPDFDYYLSVGESLDDIDEYGFTPLIECAIAGRLDVAEDLVSRGVAIDKRDIAGRSALHWAVDNNNLELAKLLLAHGADANAYNDSSMCVLVYPVLRGQHQMKHLLYRHGAKLDFAMDFILAKLLGHRFELRGDVDIINAQNEFIELDYEGFILEFTIAAVKDSLRRFTSSFSTRDLRPHFPLLHQIIDGFSVAADLLQLQHHPQLNAQHKARINQLIQAPVLILPAASTGHALGFVRYKNWWAKVDRGENSLQEGTINIYEMEYPERLNEAFVIDFLYKKQPRRFFHDSVNKILGLRPIAKMPMSSQIAGNCSWANVQAVVAVAYAMLQLNQNATFSDAEALMVYHNWVEWDKDRALDESIQRFYLANPLRKASMCSILAAVLFQSCNYSIAHHLLRAEKILTIITQTQYYYVLESYLNEYCVKRLTRKGNNLLKLLDDCGFNPNIGVTPIATDL